MSRAYVHTCLYQSFGELSQQALTQPTHPNARTRKHHGAACRVRMLAPTAEPQSTARNRPAASKACAKCRTAAAAQNTDGRPTQTIPQIATKMPKGKGREIDHKRLYESCAELGRPLRLCCPRAFAKPQTHAAGTGKRHGPKTARPNPVVKPLPEPRRSHGGADSTPKAFARASA